MLRHGGFVLRNEMEMQIGHFTRRHWKTGCAVLGCWTFLALLFTPQTYFTGMRSPTPLTPKGALFTNLILFYLWAALTPAVLWLGARFPLERRRLARRLVIHLLLSGPVALAHVWLLRAVSALLPFGARSYQPTLPLPALLIGLGATDVMIYWGIVAVSQAASYFRKFQERELRLARAQLQSLRSQLHPHFLFNTLNAIAELIHKDPAAADRSILCLSELLRSSLAGEAEQEVTLKDEVDFLEKYVEIQKTLMRDRLEVRVTVEPAALDARVPNMLLQPLVENAIRHGIAPRPEGGSVEVSAKRLDDGLVLEVADDGLGMPEQRRCTGGVGLVNTRERLRYLYGDAHAFDLSNFPGRGVTVRIRVPFREDVFEGDDANAYH